MVSNADDTASPGLLNSLHPSRKTEAKQSRIIFHNHTAGREELHQIIPQKNLHVSLLVNSFFLM